MKRLIIGGAAAIVIAGGVLTAIWLRDRDRPPPAPGQVATAALVAGFERAITAATAISEPFHCAELAEGQEPARTLTAGGRRISHHGLEVTAAPARRDHRLVLGVVADARGAEPATLAQLAEVHRQFTRAHVELVLSLGGMGQDRDQLLATLGALVDPAWVVIAIPGDREAIPDHEAAIAELTDRGAAIIDGARARIIEFDGVSIATLPGLDQPRHLVAGADGCRHTGTDAATAAALLAARPQPRVWAGYAPPRQTGKDGSDLTLDAIHVGERELAEPIAGAQPALVLTAQVEEAAQVDLRGTQAIPASAPRYLAAGAIEAMRVDGPDPDHRTGSALIITLTSRQLRWRRLILHAPPPPRR